MRYSPLEVLIISSVLTIKLVIYSVLFILKLLVLRGIGSVKNIDLIFDQKLTSFFIDKRNNTI